MDRLRKRISEFRSHSTKGPSSEGGESGARDSQKIIARGPERARTSIWS